MGAQRAEEDLMRNPFLGVLRKSFEGLYRRAAERGDTTLLVPCAECLEKENFGQVFVETHVLRAAPVPGCFINLCGQGVEIKDASVSTHLGFQDMRTCEVLQTESMYDFGNHFRVLVTDRPLIGRYRAIQAATDRQSGLDGAAVSSSAGATSIGATPEAGIALQLPRLPGTADQPLEWMNAAPTIQGAHFDEVDRFRKTFVQVPGCEQSTAERIREIVADTVQKLVRHHKLSDQPSQQRQLDYQVGRNTYAALHSFLWPHLQQILSKAEHRLENCIRSYATVEDLIKAIPGALGRGLDRVDLTSCSDILGEVCHKISPHEKVTCVDEAHLALQRCIAEGSKLNRGGGLVEITGDDVLSLFILAVYRSGWKERLAHVAHIEMYLQGASSRTGGAEAARFEEAGYAVSALQAAIQFFLEERRRAPVTASRGERNVIASYLQQPGAMDS